MAAAITTQFAISFFTALISQDSEENLLCSPASISSALALVAAGSRGNTLDEIGKVFGLKHDSSVDLLASKVLKEMKDSVQECSGACALNAANALWLEQDFEALKSYTDFLKAFDVVVSKADFKNNSKDAAAKVNKWVSDITNGKIMKLFPDGQLDETTKAVLVNALYFKGSWAKPFDKKLTKNSDFHVSSSTPPISVDMMFHSGDFKYLYQYDCSLVELPYASGEFSMTILVPHEIDGLSVIQSSINLDKITTWMKSLQGAEKETVDVFLPKFKVSQKIDMKSHFSGLGVKDMFTNKADLSGISGGKDLYISSAFHQAVVEVNEEGTEAAAATGLGVSFMSLPPELRADRPFLFWISSSKTNSLLFLGKVYNPNK